MGEATKDGAVTSGLSDVDGQRGRLTVRGHRIEDLAGKATFEEVTYLLWYGTLPSEAELAGFSRRIVGCRELPAEALAAVEVAARRMGPLDALRFAVAALTCDDPDPADDSREANLDRACRLVARVPVIVATYQQLREGGAAVTPRADLGIAANFLYQLRGEEPQPSEAKGLDTYLVTVADHGMNASTFTARVIASTASDMVSAVTGALGALKGSLHGGAPGPALSMIGAIGPPDRAAPWRREHLAQGRRVMGVGHRVYKVRDPRGEVRDGTTVELADGKVLRGAKPGRNLTTNVESYTALLLRELGLSQDLVSPTFAIGRTAGWIAHILERRAAGR